jgi:peptide/nickel transport system permease protein
MTMDSAGAMSLGAATGWEGGTPPSGGGDARDRAAEAAAAQGEMAASRSLGRQALIDTLARPGARVGLVWIALLVLMALFAPFIANSMPVLVKMDGKWSSPLVASLRPSDVTLLAAALSGTISLWLVARGRLKFGGAVLITLLVVAITLPLAIWPGLVEVRQYGELTHNAMIGWGVLGALDLAGMIWLALAVGGRLWVRGRVILAVALLPLMGLVAFPVRPPLTVVYDKYRALEARGKLQSVTWAPIPYSPSDYEREQHLLPPSRQHLLGTEVNGGDILSWMIHAARIALAIGFISTGISVTIGIAVGGLMGYFAGTIDILGMRLIEIVEAVPPLILLLTFCAFFDRNLYLMMAIIGLVNWTNDARFIRAEFLRLRRQDFVQAAIASGLPRRSIIFRHMLPNGITPVLVNIPFEIAAAILYESTLSFLGLGLVDEPSWGQLLNQARSGGEGLVWWIATTPGLAIFLTVLSYNLIGEAIRDALDPKLRKRV